MNKEFLCPACLNLVEQDKQVCPHCGFSISNYSCGSGMRSGLLLKRTYYVGQVLETENHFIRYLARDREGRYYILCEYFPVDFAQRKYKSVLSQDDTMTVEAISEVLSGKYLLGMVNFLDLFSLMKGVSLPAMTTVLDVFRECGTAYSVFPLLPGNSLQAHMVYSKSIIGEQFLLPKLRPILESIDQLHQRGLIHGGICPNNLFLTEDKASIFLTGFGEILYDKNKRIPFGLPTDTGHFYPPQCGTESGSVSPWMDIYMFSATLYFLFTGKVIPKNEKNPGKYQLLIRNELLGRGISGETAEVILRGVCLDPEKRFSSMKEVQMLLYGDGNKRAGETPKRRKRADRSKEPENKDNLSWLRIIAILSLMVVFGVVGYLGYQIYDARIRNPRMQMTESVESENLTASEVMTTEAQQTEAQQTEAEKTVKEMETDTGIFSEEYIIVEDGEIVELEPIFEPVTEEEVLPLENSSLESGIAAFESGDYDLAEKYFASVTDDPQKFYYLGRIADEKADYIAAELQYEKALASDGLSDELTGDTCYRLGYHFEKGLRHKSDLKKAADYYKEGRELQNSCCAYRLGLMYETGNGVLKNTLQAKECYKTAMNLQNPDAFYLVGLEIEEGTEAYPNANPEEAFKYFEKAYSLGSMEAANKLGTIYADPSSDRYQPKKAEQYFKAAAEAGNENAKSNLERIQESFSQGNDGQNQ